MIDIKMFQVGQTAYECVNDSRNRTLREVTVEKIGRKYVTLSGAWKQKFGVRDPMDGFLVEEVTYGTPNYLFLSKEEYELFVEERELDLYIRRDIDRSLRKMTIEQKRQIAKWMEGQS